MKFEITVLAVREENGPFVMMDRCTLEASDTKDAAQKYAALFADGE